MNIEQLNLLVNQKIVLIQNPTMIEVMKIFTSLMNAKTAIVLGLMLLILLLKRKQFKKAMIFGSALSLTVITVEIMKLAFHVERPAGALIDMTDYSFPSGHSAVASVFFLSLIYLFKDSIKNRYAKYLFVCTNIFLILLIGFSRIYLGVHLLSEVIAGFAVGVFFICTTVLLEKLVFKSTD
ncbi:MAG: phosphatase PAP2 family protein [Candidatus Gracilibacteria bacterium]